MHVSLTYNWDDGSGVDVHLDDGLDGEYNPLRTAEMAGYARDLLRNAVADREHSRAEHEQ